MAVFRVQVFYQLGSIGKWSNVWHADAASIPAVQTAMSAVGVLDLQPLLHPDATLLRFLVSDDAGTDFQTTEVNAAGSSSASDSLLPLFNSVKAILASGGLGRPDLKYFKGLVTEAMQNNGEINPTDRSALDVRVTTLLSDMDAAGVPLCSHEGDHYTGASIQVAVQMRQMHRKRRKVTP
jgi:hypothetical protein